MQPPTTIDQGPPAAAYRPPVVAHRTRTTDRRAPGGDPWDPTPYYLPLLGCVSFAPGETVADLARRPPPAGADPMLAGLWRANLAKFAFDTGQALDDARAAHVASRRRAPESGVHDGPDAAAVRSAPVSACPGLDPGASPAAPEPALSPRGGAATNGGAGAGIWTPILADLTLASIYILHRQFATAEQRLEALDEELRGPGHEDEARYCRPVVANWLDYARLRRTVDPAQWSPHDLRQLPDRAAAVSPMAKGAVAHTLFFRGLSCLRLGALDQATEHLQAAAEIATRERWHLIEGLAMRALGIAAARRGAVVEALALFGDTRTLFEGLGFHWGLFRVHDSLAQTYLAQGDLRSAHHHTVLMLDCYATLKLDRFYTGAYSRLGEIHLARGRCDEALDCLGRDAELARSQRDPRAEARAAVQIGRVHLLEHRPAGAREQFARAVDLAHSVEDRAIERDARAALAEGALASGDLAGALAGVAALAAEGPPVDRALAARLARVRGIVAREQGDADTALHYLQTALAALADGERPSQAAAELRLEIARTLRQQGDRRQALEQLRAALALAQRLGIDPLQEAVLRELERLDPHEAETLRYQPFLMTQALASARRVGVREEPAQRTHATVLFVDIRGFTALTEQLAVEDLGAMVNEFLELMSDAVIDHHGEVNKFIGDAVMAVWIAGPAGSAGPPARAEHARRAVRTGLAMLAELRNFNQRLALRGLPPLAVGVGIAGGPAIAGTFGGRQRREYSVLGDVVNTAARLEGLGRDAVIVLDDTYRLVAGEFPDAQALDPVRVKGKAEPVQAWRLALPEKCFHDSTWRGRTRALTRAGLE